MINWSIFTTTFYISSKLYVKLISSVNILSILNYKLWSLSSLKYSACVKCQATSILEMEAFCSPKNIKRKLPTIIPTEQTHKNPLYLVLFLLFPRPCTHKAICFVSYSKWAWDTRLEQNASAQFNGVSFRTSPDGKRMQIVFTTLGFWWPVKNDWAVAVYFLEGLTFSAPV